MIPLAVLLLAAAADPDDGLAKKLFPVYVQGAETYSIAVESAPDKALELRKEPVFEWANPARGNTQGVVFVWLRDGRPAALGCFFSYPHQRLPGRVIAHELHALDSEKLVVKRDSPNEWKPKVGLERKVVPDAPEPAATPAARLVQMRRLAQEFNGHEIDYGGTRWDLRLLPTPLYRYPSAKTGVLDGAVFALMSNAGTDPEVLLVVEAKETNGKARWEYALGRFSDWDLHVRHKETEVFTFLRREASRPDQPRLELYRIYPEKVVTPEGKLLAQVRRTPNGPALVPVEDK
jgi:hypothetical protein